MLVAICVARPVAGESSSPSFFPLQEHWVADLGEASSAPPAFDEQRAYVPLRDGRLVAVSLDDGQLAWSVEMPTGLSPAVGGGTLVVAQSNLLIGLHAPDALPTWTVALPAHPTAAPVWASGWLVVVLANGEVVVFRGSDGTELWRRDVGGSLTVGPSVAGTEVFVPVADGRLVALDLETGRLLWERRLGGSPQQILPLDALFVGATDNFFYRLSREDGRLEWRWRTGGDVVGLAAVDERFVFFVSLDNIVRALDRESGVQQWRRALQGRPRGGPQIVGDMVLVSGVSPRLRAYHTDDGVDAGMLVSAGEFASVPFVIPPSAPRGPGLVAMTGDGRLVGMFEATGPPRLSLSFPPPPLLPGPEVLEPADVLPVAAEPVPASVGPDGDEPVTDGLRQEVPDEAQPPAVPH